ncbi:MAG: hypothetical protein RLZZ262_1768 [Bacteroidota bacterium]
MHTKKILRNLIPIGLLGFNLYLFFDLIPIHIAREYSVLFAIVGGVFTMILSIWIIFSWITSDKLADQAGIPAGLFSVSMLFVFGFYFISCTSNFHSKELATNGVRAVAVVTDKTQIYGKGARTIQSIDVDFFTNSNERVSANISVTERFFDELYEGMQIPIIYSSKYPNLAEIDYKLLTSK